MRKRGALPSPTGSREVHELVGDRDLPEQRSFRGLSDPGEEISESRGVFPLQEECRRSARCRKVVDRWPHGRSEFWRSGERGEEAAREVDVGEAEFGDRSVSVPALRAQD